MQAIIEGNVIIGQRGGIEITDSCITIRGRFIAPLEDMQAAGVLELVGMEPTRGLRRVVVSIARWLLRR
jgi:hypothetical protein